MIKLLLRSLENNDIFYNTIPLLRSLENNDIFYNTIPCSEELSILLVLFKFISRNSNITEIIIR